MQKLRDVLMVPVLLSALFFASPALADDCEPANVLILMDVSGSMGGAANPASKYNAAVHAVNGFVTAFDDTIRFGLMVFPDPSQGYCGISSTVAVEPALGNASVIQNYLDPEGLTFFGGPTATFDTPMYQALVQVGALSFMSDPARRSYVLLIADGMQDCCRQGDYDADPDCDSGTTNLNGQELTENREDLRQIVDALTQAGNQVFVVGFGAAVETRTLNAMAVAAGTQVSLDCDPNEVDASLGLTCYYPVDGETELADALGDIAIKVDTEVCDSLDNDCDGQTDEDFTLGTACDGPDTDQCANGEMVCDVYGGVVCDESGDGQAETCDGNDNDCDGTTDDGFALGLPCDGGDEDKCTNGLTICNVAGDGVICHESDTNQIELCDAIDNDCDGTTDEGFDVGKPCDGNDDDVCENGITACSADGTYLICDESGAGENELCNGVDDNCNGETDEGFSLGVACDGADDDQCEEGETVCNQTGDGLACDEGATGHVETCNGLDDDCDGQTDEDSNVSCNTACGTGVQICENGVLATCDAPIPAVIDECGNGLDDDCDSLTDEDWSNECETACGTGFEVCKDGVFTECDAPQPKNEVCDLIDNDCNDLIDDGPLCVNAMCFCGACQVPCTDDSECNGLFCVEGFCLNDKCPDGEHCVSQECVPGDKLAIPTETGAADGGCGCRMAGPTPRSSTLPSAVLGLVLFAAWFGLRRRDAK